MSGQASTSDARKRRSEAREHGGQLDTFVDPYAKADVGEPTVGPSESVTVPRDALRWALNTLEQAGLLPEPHGGVLHSDDLRDAITPPPAPVPVWSVLSTDREKPTRAVLTFVNVVIPVAGDWYIDGPYLKRTADGLDWRFEDVATVTLLATLDPSEKVPVDRALIERLRNAKWFDEVGRVIESLAALADGNQS